MATIGERIKRIRESKNYTQEHVAGKLGISQNSYSKLETGGVKVTTDRLQQIADIFEIPVEQLWTDENQTFNFHNSHIERFYGYIEHLQDDNKEQLKLLGEQIKYLQTENNRLLSLVEKLTTKK